MGRLTQKEKISLIYWLAPAIDRLGIEEYHLGDECLHGLVRPDKNTVFPEAIGLGATFDPDAIHEMTAAISDEARARWNQGHHFGNFNYPLVLWSPVINMARDPRWGRNQETYGEDPWLASRLGVAFVKGLQGDDPHYIKVISTPKHFAGNNEESGRMGKNIVCDERYLREFELFPFAAAIQEGNAQSTMAAYTAINGVPCSANKWLLTDVLRKEWGFKGFVVSDCGAVSHVVDAHRYTATPEEAIAACLNAGLDDEGGYFAKYPDVVDNFLPLALQKGLVTSEVLDQAVSRVLTARFRLGMYDPADRVPYSKIPMSVIDCPEHIALARKLGDESLVLLKNSPVQDEPLLPIDPAKSGRIVVVGPNANVMQYGDYSGSAAESVTPFDGIKARAEKAGLQATLIPWTQASMAVVPSSSLKPAGTDNSIGLSGEYFSSPDLSGAPAGTRVDAKINFDWAHIEPDPLASAAKFSVRWTGKLMTDTAGAYTFSITADGGFRLFLDEKKIIDNWSHTDAKRVTAKGELHSLEPGGHTIKIEYHHDGGETGFVWSWSPPAKQEDVAPRLKNAGLVIAVMGISTEYEIEGKDRNTLSLPPEQEEFLHQVQAANPRTVVVFESGSPLAVPWEAENIPALVQAWYPGEQGGNVIADILFGDYNPSGRLPLTFYADDSQLRPMNEYDITKGRTYMYFTDKPAYAFGHGLSYTTFKYDQLQLSTTSLKVGDPITVHLNVTNDGKVDGEEVVQVYVHAQQSTVAMPIRQLWAFQRVHMVKGETKSVALTLDASRFGHWDKDRQKFVVEPGAYDVQVGAASDDIRLRQTVRINP